MIEQPNQLFANEPARRRRGGASGFSLIELLTVVFIITILIGILVPSINSARTAAKKVTTAKTIDSIKVGLELFKNDNGADFRQTNGYPPSFSHPIIPGYQFDPYLGEFPFAVELSEADPPVVYGAHWLPAMLMGVDHLGYVKKSDVPRKDEMRQKPWRWYSADPFEEGPSGKSFNRQALYLDPGSVKTMATNKLPGRPPEHLEDLFPSWQDDNTRGMQSLPVIVDAFDQPILYYVASTHGQPQNMVEDVHLEPGLSYSRSTQQQNGIPYYFHQDNIGFTGNHDHDGWDFGHVTKKHAIAESGAILIPQAIVEPANHETFARYILDRKLYGHLVGSNERNAPAKPVNSDTFLLISAGPDGRYGTTDDVTNLPPWLE